MGLHVLKASEREPPTMKDRKPFI